MTRQALLLFVSCLGLALFSAQAKTDPALATGPTLYFPCESCHSENGEGSEVIHAPALAGQHPSYISRQLKHFRDGQRGEHPQDTYGRQMALMAANLRSDEDIATLADYVASFPLPKPLPAGKTVPENGAKLYTSCAACHGKNGAGNSALLSPKIGGLDSLYIATQLKHYSQSVRAYSPQDTAGQQMRAAIKFLTTDAEIEAVSVYISKLSGRAE